MEPEKQQVEADGESEQQLGGEAEGCGGSPRGGQLPAPQRWFGVGGQLGPYIGAEVWQSALSQGHRVWLQWLEVGNAR